MMVRKAKPLPVECIVRGYLSGSGWKEYRKSGTVCGIRLPGGLVESQKLPEPLFTPSTKADIGSHDENISFEKMEGIIGGELAGKVRDLALCVYRRGAEYAAGRGILIADTKMEFGLLGGEIILIDELMTPDSSRFWRAATYEAGKPQESLDKQYVRDYLTTLDWDQTDPGPILPENVAAETSRRYLEILEILRG
jgi:phosphoribosylaminoimidazole-succinocarboxamide synthase